MSRSKSHGAGLMVRLLVVVLLLGGLAATGSAQTNSATVTGADRLVVRRGPGKQFPPFASLTEGSKVEVEEVKGEWARIVTGNGQRGYVHSNFLSISGEVPAAAPVTGAVSAETATPARAAPTEPASGRAGAERTRTAEERERKTASEGKKALEAELRTATDRTKALESELKTATERAKALESQTAALTERTKTLDSELQATRQEVVELKSRTHSPAGASEAATTPRGVRVEDLHAQLTRLTAAVEALQGRVGSVPQVSTKTASERPAVTTEPSSGSDDGLVSPTAILLGLFGIVVGWFLGGTLGRKQDRGRRPRIRF